MSRRDRANSYRSLWGGAGIPTGSATAVGIGVGAGTEVGEIAVAVVGVAETMGGGLATGDASLVRGVATAVDVETREGEGVTVVTGVEAAVVGVVGATDVVGSTLGDEASGVQATSKRNMAIADSTKNRPRRQFFPDCGLRMGLTKCTRWHFLIFHECLCQR